MIRLANAINQHSDRVRYVCNVCDDLEIGISDGGIIAGTFGDDDK